MSQILGGSSYLKISSGLFDYNAAYTVLLHYRVDTEPSGDYAAVLSVNNIGEVALSDVDAIQINPFASPKVHRLNTRSNNAGTTPGGSTAVTATNWYNPLLVRSSATAIKAWLGTNDLETSFATNDMSARSAATDFVLGALLGSGGAAGHAAITLHSCKIWTRALNSTDITAEIGQVQPASTTNLWGWWFFDNSADKWNDRSGNGRHFTLVGTSTHTTDKPAGIDESLGGGGGPVTITKTFAFASNAEGLADAGNSASLTFAHEPADGNPSGSVKFTQTAKSVTQLELGRVPSITDTWEAWGVPAGATVTNVQITGWNEKLVGNTKLSSHSIKVRVTNSGGARVHGATDLIDTTLTTTIDGSWQSGAAGSLTAVSSGNQASSTAVGLELEYACTTSGGGGSAAVDQRFDQFVLAITYTPPAASQTAAPGNAKRSPLAGAPTLTKTTALSLPASSARRRSKAGSASLSLTAAPTYYVSTTGNDTTGDGSVGNPYASITKALSVAASGSTISVADGTYNENTASTGYFRPTQIFTSYVTVKSTSGVAANVVIQGASNATYNTLIQSDAAYIRFEQVTFGMRVSTNAHALRLANSNHIQFYRCRLVCASDSGGTRFGVALQPSGATTIDSILFDECDFSQTGSFTARGVSVGWTAGNTISNVQFTNCTANMQSDCLYLQGGGYTITGGTYTSTNTHAILFGADAASGGNLTTGTITSAAITCTNGHGLAIGHNAGGVTADNCICTGLDYGIVIKENDGATVINCTATGNSTGGAAIYCKAAVNASVTYCNENQTVGVGFKVGVGDTGNKCQNVTHTNCTLNISGTANALQWGDSTADLGGGVQDFNSYQITGSGNFGTARTTSGITSLSGLIAAWTGYDVSGNDTNSTSNIGSALSIVPGSARQARRVGGSVVSRQTSGQIAPGSARRTARVGGNTVVKSATLQITPSSAKRTARVGSAVTARQSAIVVLPTSAKRSALIGNTTIAKQAAGQVAPSSANRRVRVGAAATVKQASLTIAAASAKRTSRVGAAVATSQAVTVSLGSAKHIARVGGAVVAKQANGAISPASAKRSAKVGSPAVATATALNIAPGSAKSGRRVGNATAAVAVRTIAPGSARLDRKTGGAQLAKASLSILPGSAKKAWRVGSSPVTAQVAIAISPGTARQGRNVGSPVFAVQVNLAIAPGGAKRVGRVGSITAATAVQSIAPGSAKRDKRVGSVQTASAAKAVSLGSATRSRKVGASSVTAQVSLMLSVTGAKRISRVAGSSIAKQSNITIATGSARRSSRIGAATIAIQLYGFAPGSAKRLSLVGSATLSKQAGQAISLGSTRRTTRAGTVSLAKQSSQAIAPGSVVRRRDAGSIALSAAALLVRPGSATRLVVAGSISIGVQILAILPGGARRIARVGAAASSATGLLLFVGSARRIRRLDGSALFLSAPLMIATGSAISVRRVGTISRELIIRPSSAIAARRAGTLAISAQSLTVRPLSAISVRRAAVIVFAQSLSIDPSSAKRLTSTGAAALVRSNALTISPGSGRGIAQAGSISLSLSALLLWVGSAIRKNRVGKAYIDTSFFGVENRTYVIDDNSRSFVVDFEERIYMIDDSDRVSIEE